MVAMAEKDGKVSGTVNGILQCGLGGQKLSNGEKKRLLSKMRTHFRAFADLLVVILIKIPQGL